MSVITASIVNELRKKTGAGMMDCKKALQENDGDMEKAIDYLRKKGQKISANRADREAGEGAIIALTSEDQTYGVIVELNCETDFVAKNQDFVDLANAIAQIALENKPADLEALKALELNGSKISDRLVDEIGKIGEKIELSSYEMIEGEGVVSYIHMGNRIGVLVALNQAISGAVETAGKDVAMQIAAMNPVSLSKEDVPQEVIDREMEIGRDQARQEGKPENIIDKIAEGKLNKFFKESTLLNQDFVKDSSKTISKMLDDVSKGLTVTSFKRVALA
jgi:elongation factor Ts